MILHGLKVTGSSVFAFLVRLGSIVVRKSGQGHFGVHKDFSTVWKVQDEVRTHELAGFLVADTIAVLVTEPVLRLVVYPFAEPLVLEHILQDGFSEVALHLVLALKSLGQVFGLGSNSFSLLFQMLDCLGKLGFDGRGLLGVRLLLGFKSLRHTLDGLVQTTGDILHSLRCFLL